MTTPDERTRALRYAGELLKELLVREDVPVDLRNQARGVLRHYPEEWLLHQMAVEWQKTASPWIGLAPEPGRAEPGPLIPRSGS